MNEKNQSEFSTGFVMAFAKVFKSKIYVHNIDRLSPYIIILQGELIKNGDPVFIAHDHGELYYADPNALDEKPDPITIQEFVHKVLYEL